MESIIEELFLFYKSARVGKHNYKTIQQPVISLENRSPKFCSTLNLWCKQMTDLKEYYVAREGYRTSCDCFCGPPRDYWNNSIVNFLVLCYYQLETEGYVAVVNDEQLLLICRKVLSDSEKIIRRYEGYPELLWSDHKLYFDALFKTVQERDVKWFTACVQLMLYYVQKNLYK